MIWREAEQIFLDRVKSCSYDERHLLPLQLVLLLLVVLVAPLLVLINGRGDFLQHPKYPRLHTVHYKASLHLCTCLTIMTLPLFSGRRSHEWTPGPRLLSVMVCPFVYPHSCPGISNGIVSVFLCPKEKGGGINYYQNCGLQEAPLIACREMFCKDKNGDKLSERAVL